MNTFHNVRFGRNSNSFNYNAPLTIDQLQRDIPSAFAIDKHESRSARYTFIPTSEVISAMMREGFQPFKAIQSRSRIEGKTEFTKHMIRFRHANSMQANVGDSLPEVILINSHDGTSAYKLIAGLFRLVCSNGMVVSESEVGSLSVPHKGDIVNQVIEGSFQIVDDSAKALDSSKRWGSLQLTNGEQNIFAEAAHALRFDEPTEGETATPIQPAQLLTARRSADYGNDLWKTFNRVQENAVRGGLRARAERKPGERIGRMVTTREVKGIDQDVKLNRALWLLSERMAELKGVESAA